MCAYETVSFSPTPCTVNTHYIYSCVNFFYAQYKLSLFIYSLSELLNCFLFAGDLVGQVLAWSSLLPFCLCISFVTLIVFRRDLHTVCTLQKRETYTQCTPHNRETFSYTQYVHYTTGRFTLQLHTVCTLHNRETYYSYTRYVHYITFNRETYTTVTHGMYTTEQGDLQLHTVCTWNLQDILT